MIFPWHNEVWQRLTQRRGQLPHALLLQGRPGLGKSALALEFGQALLCESPRPDATACGACAACGWFSQGNHPDFRLVQPESLAPEAEDGEGNTKKEKKKSDQIKVDQVRALEGFLGVGTHRGGLRVIVLDPADSMNVVTQNALLKNLEEPPKGTAFILVTSRPQQLLATVRSRCQIVTISQPALEIASKWLMNNGSIKSEAEAAALLNAAGGAPLAALKGAETAAVQAALLDALEDASADPLAMAQQFEGLDAALVIGWLQRWVMDIFRAGLAQAAHFHPQRQAQIERIARGARLPRLGRYEQELRRARALAAHPLNARLFLEELFIGYKAAVQ